MFEHRIFATWILDCVFAFALGVVFPYCASMPMRGLGFWRGIGAALTADAASPTALPVAR